MGTTVILDLFGNTSTTFKQEDDTLALAVKHVVGGEGMAHVGRCCLHSGQFHCGTGHDTSSGARRGQKSGQNFHSAGAPVRFQRVL